MPAAAAKASGIEPGTNTARMAPTALKAYAPPTPSNTPTSPPIRLRMMASRRNWSRTSRGRAPSACRKPISRVRSVTLTSMIFMMPMPPTTKEMAATQPSKRRNPDKVHRILAKAGIGKRVEVAEERDVHPTVVIVVAHHPRFLHAADDGELRRTTASSPWAELPWRWRPSLPCM